MLIDTQNIMDTYTVEQHSTSASLFEQSVSGTAVDEHFCIVGWVKRRSKNDNYKQVDDWGK